MNVEECQALGSSQFMLMVSFPYASLVCHFSIIIVASNHYYIPFFVLDCFVVDAIIEYILRYNFD